MILENQPFKNSGLDIDARVTNQNWAKPRN